jgi:hypothetical protein
MPLERLGEPGAFLLAAEAPQRALKIIVNDDGPTVLHPSVDLPGRPGGLPDRNVRPLPGHQPAVGALARVTPGQMLEVRARS